MDEITWHKESRIQEPNFEIDFHMFKLVAVMIIYKGNDRYQVFSNWGRHDRGCVGA